MVPHRGRASGGVDREPYLIPHAHSPERDAPAVDDQSLDGFLGVLDLDTAVRPLEGAGVTNLAAALRVERGGLHHDLDPLRLRYLLRLVAIPEQGQHARARFQRLVADEARPRANREAVVDLGRGPLARALPGRSGALGLLLHARIERRAIVVETLAVQDGLGQVRGEAERVVELEDHVAGQSRPSLAARPPDFLVHERKAPPQRASEALLLALDGLQDKVPALA